MKRIFWIVLGAALAGPGCFQPVQRPEQVKPAPPPPAPPPPAVTADGITEANARAKAEALALEMNYATKSVATANDQ